MSTTERGYGVNLAASLLDYSPERVIKIFIDNDKRGSKVKALLDKANDNNVSVENCSRSDFYGLLKQSGIEESAVHQGVLVEFLPAEAKDEKWLVALIKKIDAPFFLALDGVTDPHNLGACLRSANAAGVDAVIVPKDKSAGITPAVRKVACGATEMTPVVSVKNLARCLDNLRKQNIWVMGAAGEAEQSLYDLDFKGGLLIVMGAEGGGLRRLTREHCDHLFKIPMQGSIESLNVSVATGISLFEAARQRQGVS